MKANAEKRTCDRHSYTAPIVFSYFNKDHCFEAQTHNHCAVGMGFQSNFFLQPGATIYVRIKNFYPSNSCTDPSRGLHSVTLAEVKWCDEELGVDEFPYAVGVKYYAPGY
jgi:hypothetical protein